MSRGIRRGICCRCLPDACSASPIKLGEMRKTKLYQSCHASRPRSCHRSHRRRGITSACAEQTPDCPTVPRAGWDHLRVCGADKTATGADTQSSGSPPRVRSRLDRTPVEQSLSVDHLCVCGADNAQWTDIQLESGSPPRVRSRPVAHPVDQRIEGITSACAEQTAREVTAIPR